MRIVSLRVSGYRQFLEPTLLDFPIGLTGVCGPNGVGKSKLIEAIGFALFGPSKFVLPAGDRLSDLPSKGGEDAKPSVELVIEVQGEPYEIVRTPRRTFIRRRGAADTLANTPTNVNRKVVELLRLSPSAYSGTFVARQKDIAGLQALGGRDRVSLVNRMIGITQVERSLDLARQARRTRAQAWETARTSPGMTQAEASAQLDACIAERESAVDAEATAESAAVAARLEDERALGTVVELQARATVAQAAQRELATLAGQRATWEGTLTSARARVRDAQAAADELSAARAVLAATEDSPALLSRYEELAEVAGLREQQERLQRDLDERLVPLDRERSALLTALDADDAAIRSLEEEIAEREGIRQLASQAMEQANESAEGHKRFQERAARQGRAGTCPTCGQVFGDNLDQALAHYAYAAAEARNAGRAACERAAEAQRRRAVADEMVETRRAARQDRAEKIPEYETVPGDLAHRHRELRELATRIIALDARLAGQLYDVAAHASAREAVSRRELAERDSERLRPLAAQESSARADELAAERELEKLTDRQRDLEATVARDAPAIAELITARARQTATKAARADAERLAREQSRRAAGNAERVNAAQRDLELAAERERIVATAHRELAVAESTVTLLERLLAEITEEARPRIAEYLNEWAPSLLGPHFRSVDLTSEYRIQADNGSGLHEIEHFSGGEQTLLAIMLRVAIARFCRERAGFDTGFLILDEIFGDQDAAHRAQLVQFLEEIKPQYHQILIVNHVDDVTDMLDSIIDVKPTGASTSTAELRAG